MPKFTKTQIAKFITVGAVGTGTNTIVKQIIDSNVETTNIYQRVTVGAASFVISAMTTAKTKEFTDAGIDQLIENWNKVEEPKAEVTPSTEA